MGRTAATARAVVVATVAVGALLLGGCESVGTWTPASKGGPTPAAASPPPVRRRRPRGRPRPRPPTPRRRARPQCVPEPVAEPDGIRDAHPDGEADPDDETDAVADGEAATTSSAATRAPGPAACRDASVRLATGSASRRVVRVAHPAGGLRAPEVGLRRDGVVGPRTDAPGGRHPARVTLSGDGVEIVLDRQILVVVRDGRAHTILNTSTGNGEEYRSTSGNRAIATTPRGRFTVYRAVDGQLTNSLGELWPPLLPPRVRRARVAERAAVAGVARVRPAEQRRDQHALGARPHADRQSRRRALSSLPPDVRRRPDARNGRADPAWRRGGRS